MVNIVYNGERANCRIQIYNKYIDSWSRGEVKVLSDREAEKLLRENKDFSLAGKEEKVEKVKKQEENPEEKRLEFDLNNDGVVDSADYSIAARTLGHARRSKKK